MRTNPIRLEEIKELVKQNWNDVDIAKILSKRSGKKVSKQTIGYYRHRYAIERPKPVI